MRAAHCLGVFQSLNCSEKSVSALSQSGWSELAVYLPQTADSVWDSVWDLYKSGSFDGNDIGGRSQVTQQFYQTDNKWALLYLRIISTIW